MTNQTDLLPALPNDVALECLIRLPFDQFSTVSSVCKGWKVAIELPEFRRRRKASGLTCSIIAMAQARVDLARKSQDLVKVASIPTYRLVICNPTSGLWSELPPLPGFSEGLPMFCQVLGVGLNLVVLGGYHPVTWEVFNSVFIYDFVLARWHRGADMPGGQRSLFGATSDCDRLVLIAGGHDGSKNALKSAMIYDVAKNEWLYLPDMARQRDECKVVFQCGKFHVIGGYQTEMQGRFGKSAETFDVATWEWNPVEEEFLGASSCPRTCCLDDSDETIYMCREGNLIAADKDTWKVVAGLPAEVANVAFVTTWQDKLLVIGSAKFGEPHKTYTMNPKNRTWIRSDVPEEYSGHVQSGCCLEI